jgi:UDP-N-acetylglucosamine 1-carboxyvinyltransferase
MDKFIIEGGRPLHGTVRVQGAKNAALPMMAAAILSSGPVVLRNVPDLMDIRTMAGLLERLGVRSRYRDGTLMLTPSEDGPVLAPYELVSQMRASFCVLGPLLARRGRAQVSLPGGCVIGVRPVDLHLRGMERLGAQIRLEGGYVHAEGPIRGGLVYLGGSFGSSVTGTANVLMAAVLAPGTTTIESAACEPEVQELARMLVAMGARIEGIGSPRLVVEGVERLSGVEWEILPDRIEAGTFLAAGAIAGGDVKVLGAREEHLTAVLEAFSEIGVHVERCDGGLRVVSNGMHRSCEITTLPYPGFPTDLQAQFAALLSVADGISVITEKVYPDRWVHVAELARMGARIRKEGSGVVIRGVGELSGAPVMASDIRASAGLVLAGLRARGTTEISRVYHIDRGYERIERKLQALGARIERVRDKRLIVVEEPKAPRLRGWAAAL